MQRNLDMTNSTLYTNKQQKTRGDNKISCLADRLDDNLAGWIKDTQKSRKSQVQSVCDACQNNKRNSRLCRELIIDKQDVLKPNYYKPHILVDDTHKVYKNL